MLAEEAAKTFAAASSEAELKAAWSRVAVAEAEKAVADVKVEVCFLHSSDVAGAARCL